MIFAVFIIIMVILGVIGVPILDYLLECLKTDGKSTKNSIYNQKNKSKTYKKTTLPGVHEDYDEENKKELIKEGVYDETSFEEEELEEDDYYYEDDK